MQEYAEYAKGKDYLKGMIILYSEFVNESGLNENYYYPIVSIKWDDEKEFVENIKRLPMEKVKVCLTPGAEPIDMDLYIEADWAYSIKEI